MTILGSWVEFKWCPVKFKVIPPLQFEVCIQIPWIQVHIMQDNSHWNSVMRKNWSYFWIWCVEETFSIDSSTLIFDKYLPSARTCICSWCLTNHLGICYVPVLQLSSVIIIVLILDCFYSTRSYTMLQISSEMNTVISSVFPASSADPDMVTNVPPLTGP